MYIVYQVVKSALEKNKAEEGNGRSWSGKEVEIVNFKRNDQKRPC